MTTIDSTATTIAQRNLAAECRFVEEGHHVRLDADHHVLLVTSDTRPGVTYELVPRGVGGYLVVTCSCPAGVHRSVAAGQVPCKHASGVARRLEREGLACLGRDGLWRVPMASVASVASVADPFDGLV